MNVRTIQLHGHEIAYRIAGDGPVVLLIHGMAGSASTWKRVMPQLAERFTVIAPDLPGHGRSDKPRGDYSLGASASFLRDLLAALGHSGATVVGQSLGGGIAMQFSYQYPERCERLVLVGSGGLGEDVMPILRALALPGVDLVMPVAFLPAFRDAGDAMGRFIRRLGLQTSPQVDEIWWSYSSLVDGETRAAFMHTLRAVIDRRGQRVSAHDKLHMAAMMPTLIMWGDHDPIIPVAHAHDAHRLIPGSRLEIFEGAGHFPHVEQPERFTKLLVEFIDSTEPARIGSDDAIGELAVGQ